MNGYSVLVQAISDGTGNLDEDSGLRMLDLLAAHHVIAGWGGIPERWEARITVDSPGPVDAAKLALMLVTTAAHEAGLPDWPLTHLAVTDENYQDVAEDRAMWPDLVSTPEAAEILGVSQQRVRVLAAQNKRFPRPAYELASGKVWVRQAIEGFRDTWERKPGRPRRTSPDITTAPRSIVVEFEAHGRPDADAPRADQVTRARR